MRCVWLMRLWSEAGPNLDAVSIQRLLSLGSKHQTFIFTTLKYQTLIRAAVMTTRSSASWNELVRLGFSPRNQPRLDCDAVLIISIALIGWLRKIASAVGRKWVRAHHRIRPIGKQCFQRKFECPLWGKKKLWSKTQAPSLWPTTQQFYCDIPQYHRILILHINCLGLFTKTDMKTQATDGWQSSQSHTATTMTPRICHYAILLTLKNKQKKTA